MNLCKEVCLRVVAHLWSTKLAHLSASQFKNSNLSSCNMHGQGKNVLKCVPTHQKWPNYQEFLAHLAGYFCTCEYTMFRSGTKWFIYQECSFIQRSIYVECTVYIYIYICLWTKKKFESYLRDRLTFSNVDSRTSR